MIDKLYETTFNYYKQKGEINATLTFPVIKNVYERPGNSFEKIVVPFTDGNKTLNVVTQLEKAYQTKGKHLIEDFERNITLALIDEAWKNHLRKMDELKQSVQLAVHEQKDPLLIYKFEAFELFKGMIGRLNREVISFLLKGSIPSQDTSIKEAKPSATNFVLAIPSVVITIVSSIRPSASRPLIYRVTVVAAVINVDIWSMFM